MSGQNSDLSEFCPGNCGAVISYIDYVSAFDTVSHKFLGQALQEAGARPKVQAIFRAIYGAASASVRVRLPDGRCIYSDVFPVRRGVVQGDIFSPWCFILAVECLLRRTGVGDSGGLNLMGVWLNKLEYADDAALIDTSVEDATERLTTLARESEVLALSESGVALVGDSKLECVFAFRYLGVEFAADGDPMHSVEAYRL